jgi:LacI family transcriptional regulator
MKDVAALAGVSLKTVSRVVNDEPLVSEEVGRRVRDAILQLGFHPDERAGNLRRTGRKTETIGLVVSSVANPFAASVNRAIENAAEARGVALFASSMDDDPEREQPAVDALLRRRVDGLILTTVRKSQSYLLSEQSYGTPFVFVDRDPVGIEADAVVSDHAAGAATATRHLLERGHRRIAYLGDRSDIQSARERQRGFSRELGRAGVSSLNAPMVVNLHDVELAERTALEILSTDNRPTAIFSSQNLITVGVLRALRHLGLQHSVALVGFDDLPMADLLDPGITVVAQHPESIGALAAERLFARLDGDTQAPRTFIVPTTLIPRGTGEILPNQ